MSDASHVYEEHTGEVQIRIEAPTLGELFAEAGRALMNVMGGASPRTVEGPPTTVTVHSIDRDALLVDWLNELVYLVETERKLYGEIFVERISDRELTATVRGADAPELRTLVKAASFFGLAIAERASGYTATVVLDV